MENNFLDSLGSYTFYLGLTDSVVEGDWAWGSDSTQVTWKNWVDWAEGRWLDPPNGGTRENCAWMLKQFQKSSSGHSTKAWADTLCDQPIDVKEMSVVCEKGKDIFIILFIITIAITLNLNLKTRLAVSGSHNSPT